MKLEGNILYIHQSDLGTLRKCPEQARLDTTGELYNPDSDSAIIGTHMHTFIEEVLNHRKTTGLWMSAEDALEIVQRLQAKLTRDWPSIHKHPHQIADLGEAIGYIEQACLNWWQHFLPMLNGDDPSTWRIEHPFDIKIERIHDHKCLDCYGDGLVGVGDGYSFDSSVGPCHCGTDIHIRGTIDFVRLAAGKVDDWKTSQPTRDNQMWKLGRYDVQSVVYSWAIWSEFGFIPEFRYQHMPRGSDKHTMNPVTPTEAHFDTMKQEVMTWASTILRLGFDEPWPIGPSDWWCSERWCTHHARNLCVGATRHIFPEDGEALRQLHSSTTVNITNHPDKNQKESQ